MHSATGLTAGRANVTGLPLPSEAGDVARRPFDPCTGGWKCMIAEQTQGEIPSWRSGCLASRDTQKYSILRRQRGETLDLGGFLHAAKAIDNALDAS
ncbi:hypothetical protein VDGL01_04698 [Verticillium dahliae]